MFIPGAGERGSNFEIVEIGDRENVRRGYFLFFFSFLNIFEDKDEAKREEIFANDQFVSLKFLRHIEAIKSIDIEKIKTKWKFLASKNEIRNSREESNFESIIR